VLLMPELFGHMPSGEPVFRVSLGGDRLRAQLLTYGAVLQTLEVPDREGMLANVVLGFGTLAEYLANGGHFGAVPGRYAGRIDHGRFMLDGVQYQLAVNKPPHTVHGGMQGFGKHNWTIVDHGPDRVTMELKRPAGDEGFPGAVRVEVSYTVSDQQIRIDYRAETDCPTIINLTNHSYFNLAGEGHGDILGHRVTLDSGFYFPIREDGIPTGELLAVDGTPFDFRHEHTIGDRIKSPDQQLQNGLGYDHAYLLAQSGLRDAANVVEPNSGRTLTVATTEPVMHFYTGNNLTGTFAGLSGQLYGKFAGVCFEAEHPQDAPNHPAFPSAILRPGTDYTATTLFRFGFSAEP
jgi:aldose 1-epimerase